MLIEAFYVERDMLELVNDERVLSEAPPLQEHPGVRHEYSEQLRDWLRRDDPDELWDPPPAADERARAVRGLGVEVVHDRLACFDLDLGDMLDPDVDVPRGLTAAMVESLLEGPSFAAPLRDPAATQVGLVVVHQSIATTPISWTTWVGALLVRASPTGGG
ncbi:hypothetical protein [Actinomycetospora atypica]|uniref:Uncharacterized protein n=1 Tax=Actinomycetospora atypica TaxID=1290095 RepID=A0ABV9YKB4_9PSEU